MALLASRAGVRVPAVERVARAFDGSAMVAQEEYSVSHTIQCGKCKQFNVKYTQAQTRSADEPMTTFYICKQCERTYKENR